MAGALLSPGCIGAPISLTARAASSSRFRVSRQGLTFGVSGAPLPRMASSAVDAAAFLPSDDVLVQYVVLRRDLIETWPLGSVVTQGCHASVAAIWSHKDDPHTIDYCGPTNLDRMHKVTLEVKGETQILTLSEKLTAAGVAHKLWIEQPENIPTCLATKPYPKSAVSSFFKKLKLCNSLMEGPTSQFVSPEQMYIDEKTLIFPRKSKNPQQFDSLASKAKWDYQHTRILLQLMASLIEDGYRRGIHLSAIGYVKLVEEFNRKTGKSLELSQLKSQIEKLRRDWKAWLSIKSPRSTCTGMSWNSNKGTWDAPEEWWTSMSEFNPHVLKFKERGLEHEDLMAQVFQGTTVTGEMHWTPSPAQGNVHFGHHANIYNDGENVGSSPPLALPSSRPNINLDDPNLGNQKRRRAEEDDSEDENSSGRERQSTGARLGRMLEHMADVVEKTGNQLHIVYNAPGCGIGDCIAKLTTLEVNWMDPLFMFAVDLFSTPTHREIFIGLPTDEARLRWLEYQKTKHSRTQGQFAGTFQCPPPPPSNSPPPPCFPQHPMADSECNHKPSINHV